MTPSLFLSKYCGRVVREARCVIPKDVSGAVEVTCGLIGRLFVHKS